MRTKTSLTRTDSCTSNDVPWQPPLFQRQVSLFAQYFMDLQGLFWEELFPQKNRAIATSGNIPFLKF